MSSYPKWMYHATAEDPLKVESEVEERLLPPGWADTPAMALELTQSVAAKSKKTKKSIAEGSDA